MAAKIKFSLTPQPTFKLDVQMPVPGQGFAPVKFTFKHRTKEDYLQWLRDDAPKLDDVPLIMAVASGWELEEPFDAEHIEQLVNGYVGAARAVFTTYVEELSKARLGN